MISNSKFPNSEELSHLLCGSLSDEEASQICERIKLNEPTDDKSRGIKLFLEDHNYNYQALISYRKKAYTKLNSSVKPAIIRNTLWIKYAAAAILIIISLGVYLNYSGSKNNDWKSCYERDPGFPTYMSKNNGFKWMSEYRAGDYSAAKGSIEVALKNGQSNDTLNYYYTICLFELHLLNDDNIPSITKQSSLCDKFQLLLAYYYWRENKLNESKISFSKLIQSVDTAVSNNALKALNKINHSQ